MNWDKLTIKAKEDIADAQKRAEANRNQMIENEHLLYGLVSQKEGIAKPILDKLGANTNYIMNDLEREFKKLPQIEGAAQVYISPHLKQAIDIAFNEAERLKDEYVSTEHLLIGITDVNESPAARILKGYGVTKDKIYIGNAYKEMLCTYIFVL